MSNYLGTATTTDNIRVTTPPSYL